MAAVYADACRIDDGVTGLKQDAHAAGSSDEQSAIAGAHGYTELAASTDRTA